MSASGAGLMLGDVFGLVALAFIAATAVMMLLRRQIIKRFRNLELVRRVHVAVATLGGLFLVLHVAYFVSYPLTTAISLGYVSSGLALAVWLTGTAFLERFRDSLYFHSTLSLSALALMVIHSSASGMNVPFGIAEVALGGATAVAVFKASQYVQRLFAAGAVKR